MFSFEEHDVHSIEHHVFSKGCTSYATFT